MHHTLSYQSVGEVGGISKISVDKISVKVTDRRNRSPGVYDIIVIFWTLGSLDIIVYLSALLCCYARGKIGSMAFSATSICIILNGSQEAMPDFSRSVWECHIG